MIQKSQTILWENEKKHETEENSAVFRDEKEEDLLKNLCFWIREGKSLWTAELCIHMKIIRSELTQLIRTACGLDEKQAEENACRMEQMVSRSVMEGIERFLRFGDAHDRILKNTDLSTLYKPGNYKFCMGIYRPEKRYPRVLAEEFFLFIPEIRLTVKEKGSFFCLKKQENCHLEQIWYRKADSWRQAEQANGKVYIPTAALTYTLSPMPSVTEGDLILAFPPEGIGPAEENCRELNVHIW